MFRMRLASALPALMLAAAAAAETAPPPWVRYVAPDRQCIRFGEYDWHRYMFETDVLSSRRTIAAREQALGEALWYLGRGTGRICSCGPKAAVLADLRTMLPELRKRPGVAYQEMKAAAHIGGVIAGIEADGIAVVPPSHEGCTR